MTRDNALWWLGIAGGLAVALSGHFDLILRAFPALSPVWQSRIELAAMVCSLVSAKLSMSPLKLSNDGKMAAMLGKL